MPATVAGGPVQNQQISLHRLLDGPSDRIICYVIPKNQRNECIQKLLSGLDFILQRNDVLESFL